MKVIVTGGAGFIGSHIADAFLARGDEVLVIDSLWEHGGGRTENVPREARFIRMDIRDADLKEIFADFKPDIIAHQAAQHSVAISAREPVFDADVNIMGLLNVLNAAVNARARKVLFASSAAIYGNVEQLPITEEAPALPIAPYGITKMVAEHYLRFYKAQHGLDFTALRYANVYGPRQDPNGEAGVIAIFIGRFLAREGVRIDSDGEQTRDYVFVDDVAEANIAAADRASGESINIGTGKRTSVNAVYRALCEASKFEAPVTRAPRRAGDARDLQFAIDRAREVLGWSASTDLRSGMQRTFEWFSRHGALARQS